MSRDEILASIADVLADVANIDRSDVTPDKEFAVLGIDSMTMLEVIVAVEDRFGLLVPDDDWPHFRTVEDLVSYIEQASVLA
jgi:acyl carrier protein